jgi:hypothetical protein
MQGTTSPFAAFMLTTHQMCNFTSPGFREHLKHNSTGFLSGISFFCAAGEFVTIIKLYEMNTIFSAHINNRRFDMLHGILILIPRGVLHLK